MVRWVRDLSTVNDSMIQVNSQQTIMIWWLWYFYVNVQKVILSRTIWKSDWFMVLVPLPPPIFRDPGMKSCHPISRGREHIRSAPSSPNWGPVTEWSWRHLTPPAFTIYGQSWDVTQRSKQHLFLWAWAGCTAMWPRLRTIYLRPIDSSGTANHVTRPFGSLT